MESAEGLRARKKAATRQALHRAAMELAVRRGLEGVTVEAIADAVEVSRRTFSNYFASKEEALLYGERMRVEQLLATLHSRPESEPVWSALTHCARELCRQVAVAEPERVAQVRLIRNHPSLAAQQAANYAVLERDLAAAIVARGASDPPSHLRARALAACFLTAMRIASQLWAEEPERSLLTLTEQSLAAVAERFE